tara:strand:+ start:3834 stop:4085 length:252 start_codon:yes stop_codon:yes gene_type:complete
MGQQQSNMVNARLDPAIKALNTGKNEDGTPLSDEDKRQYIQDIRDAMDIGFISGKETEVKSALSGGMKESRGRKAGNSAEKTR